MTKKHPGSASLENKTPSSVQAETEKRWTVMVYMAAGKDEQTERAAIADIEEMQTADTTKVNVLVQIDRKWPLFPQRFRIVNGATRQIRDSRLEQLRNMSTGNPEPLKGFLRWVKRDRESEVPYYMLVLWGHTFGLGFGRDHDEPLTIQELRSSLDVFKDPKIAILGANTCAMSYAEAAFELQNSVDYLVASQISMPFAGWPYAKILKKIAGLPEIEPEALGSDIVSKYVASFEQDVSMTFLNLGNVSRLEEPIKTLASEVSRALADESKREDVVGAFLDTAHGDVRPLIDLKDLCENLEQIEDVGVQKAANDVAAKLEKGGDIVVAHDCDANLVGLNGVGIFAPGITAAADLTRLDLHERKYKELEFVSREGNRWVRLAFSELREALAPTQQSVAEFVNGTGAATREDRTGVVQLVISLDRAFVKLDRAVIDTTKVVSEAIKGNGALRDAGTTTALSPRFAAPYLRLVGSLGAVAYAQESKRIQTLDTGGDQERSPFDRVVRSLEDLERVLGDTEKTVRRVLTHSRFGLGDDPVVKTGILGADNDDPVVKTGVLGADNDDPVVKTGVLGVDNDDPVVKTGVLGLLPWLTVTNVPRSISSSETSNVVAMYRQVAWALKLVEESVAKLEGVLRASIVVKVSDSSARHADLDERLNDQINQALSEVKEVVTNAKQVTRGVAVDPAYGLGPGAQPALRGTGRRHLALAGGLSSKYLRLL